MSEAGIKLISFDIDDTIAPIENHNPTKAAVTLFEKLKLLGFDLILLSNDNDDRVKRFGQKLGVDYISRAAKPHLTHFEELRTIYRKKYGILLEVNSPPPTLVTSLRGGGFVRRLVFKFPPEKIRQPLF